MFLAPARAWRELKFDDDATKSKPVRSNNPSFMSRNIDQRIRLSRLKIENPYAYLNGEGDYDAFVPANNTLSALIEPLDLLPARRKGRAFSRAEIESIVRKLQIALWRRRAEITGSTDVDPIQLVDPMLALAAIGYSVEVRESLGQYSAGKNSFEVAGVVDNFKSSVRISRRFKPAIQRFTAAHELGHAVLHEGVGLHRDRAPDGGTIGCWEPQEAEANLFASLFLVPGKPLRREFKARFLANEFTPTDATAFALTGRSLRDLLRKCRTDRDLARILATAQAYNGRFFTSLSERFGVSPEVVAIRLEELQLAKLA